MSNIRHAHLDWVRGLAVLIMIEAHVFDSWVRTGDRARPAFGNLMVLGGFGAPLFLFLAGLAVVLSAESKFRSSGDFRGAWRAVEKRGWQIFGLAFLFRLQSYVLGGGINPGGLLKVDILNIMGPAIALAAITGRAAKASGARLLGFGAMTVSMAMLTPVIRHTPLLNPLPDPLEWYFRPFPGRTNFTLFPWAGFVFAGAAVATMMGKVDWQRGGARFHIGLAVLGGATAIGAYEASFLRSLYARSEFWTSSPTYFFIRVGVLMSALAAAYACVHAPWRHKVSKWSPLAELGKASLFVYWIHVEMVYGIFSRPLRRSLSLEAGVLAYAAFTLFLLGLVVLKNRVLESRHAGRPHAPTVTPASI